MKIVSKPIMMTLGLLLVAGINAMAGEIVWTLTDVTFNNGNTAAGAFTTDIGITTIDSFDISVTGPATADAFTAFEMVSTGLPNGIGIASAGFAQYVDLTFASPLTSAGGTVAIASGVDCPVGCGSLIVNSDTAVSGVVITPEPSAIPCLSGGVILLGFASRRRWMRANS